MNSVIIKEPRAFLQQVHLQTRMLTLKVGIDTSIYKFPGFVWHADHLRWERKEEIRLDFELQDEIQFELFYKVRSQDVPVVVAEGHVLATDLRDCLSNQLKIPLQYNQVGVGWLYFQVDSKAKKLKPKSQFMHVRKISLKILHRVSLRIAKVQLSKNTETVFLQQINLIENQTVNQGILNLNLKFPVKMSDCFCISVLNNEEECMNTRVLLDDIKRGKYTLLEKCLKDKNKIKAGDVVIQYLLDNAFLDNQIVQRNSTVSRHHYVPNSESEKQRMFRKIDNADQTVLKINLGIDKLFKEITNNSFNMMPCAKTQFAGGRHNRKTHKKHESQSETGINSPSSLLTAEKVKDRIKFYFGASN